MTAVRGWGARLPRSQREQQIRDGIRLGCDTLPSLSLVMRCSEALVLKYAKDMPDVTLTRQERRTAVGRRTRLVLSLAAPGAGRVAA